MTTDMRKCEKCGKQLGFNEEIGIIEIKTYKMKWIDARDLMSTPSKGNYEKWSVSYLCMTCFNMYSIRLEK